MSSIYPITSLRRYSWRDNTIDKLQMFKRWQCHSIWVRAGAESNEHVFVDSSSTPDLWPFWQQPWWNSWYARDTLWVLQPQELTRRWCSSFVLPGALLSLFSIWLPRKQNKKSGFSCCSQSNSVKFLRIQISFPLPLPSKAIRRSTKIYMREREPLEKLLSILEQIAYHLDEKKPGHK